MVRQISVSNPPEPSAAADAPDLGRWLTQELRAKGSPLSSRPPPTEPLGSSPADVERAVLAGWLTRDLTPKHSVRTPAALPRSSESPSDLLLTSGSPSPSVAAEPFSLTSTDVWDDAHIGREAPAARREASIEEAPPARAVRFAADAPAWQAVVAASEKSLESEALAKSQPPSAIVPVALEEDDLSVLPGRRRAAAGSGRAKLALALLLGLLLVGIGLIVRLGEGPSGNLEAANEAAAPADNGVLLPPPPAFVAPLPSDEAAAPAHVRSGGTHSDEPDGLMDPRDPRLSLGGPSVRRYADVPSPTLSRLAREQRRLAQERDEALRKAKAAKPAKP
jgi:hypothetical protein